MNPSEPTLTAAKSYEAEFIDSEALVSSEDDAPTLKMRRSELDVLLTCIAGK